MYKELARSLGLVGIMSTLHFVVRPLPWWIWAIFGVIIVPTLVLNCLNIRDGLEERRSAQSH
ncbi:hypothetical protein SAMN05421595_1374 [Austwickia chelonae]|uniref:Uncharacterized protein n=1 Tax=Austwickia chelonae NBRC 105200 TaxID=1184607 RepID=K6ULT7_9MICO|nr:hypothetical protein [Austwickia chelonae]GAB77536.1 hypothetical protein AUCHE_05_04480 [Austwickia chelonae NBRC 105200]SEW12412.1 hypothetical protein SAMN05421595_1374 [Austwickia chelonae]